MNFKRVHRIGPFRRMATLFPATEKPLTEIRNHLAKFTGGSIDLTKRDDGLAVVCLNHEKKKNALCGKMMVDLEDIVEDLSKWTAGKGIILKGSSGNFCSGGDLDFVRQTGSPEDGFMMSTYMHNILSRFQKLPMISVALVEGIGALGGGSELSVSCDFILITESCRGIGFVHAKMGIVPAWGGTNKLVQKIGYTNALEVLSTARLLAPSECLKIGLANEIIPSSENAESFAVTWLQKRTKYDAEVVRCVKASVLAARDAPGDYETESRLFAPFWGGRHHKKALEKNIKHMPEEDF